MTRNHESFSGTIPPFLGNVTLVGALMLLLLTSCDRGGQNIRRPLLKADDAVVKAEKFVRANGYTARKVWDTSALQPESIEFLPRHEWPSFRHNSLMPRACGWLSGRKGDEPGWTVVFRYSHRLSARPDIGRAVTMDPDGSEIRIEHEDIALSAVQRVR